LLHASKRCAVASRCRPTATFRARTRRFRARDADLAWSASIEHLNERKRNRLILMACILGSAIVFVDGSVVNVALPAIQRDLGGGLVLQQWVVDAYLLTLGSLILVGGSLGDLFGGKRVFILGLGAFGVTSLLCALAQNGTILILGRGLQGIAGALLTPAALATITATFDGEERGAAIGTWTAWTGISFVIGPLAGGWLVSVASWRAIFLINPPLVLVTMALAAYSLRGNDAKRAHARVDFLGGALCVLGLGGPVFALIEQPKRGWSDPLILVSLIGGLAVFAAFIAWEARTKNPMLPLRLFRRRNFAWANAETLTVYAALSTLTFFLVIFLQQLAGYSPIQSGLATVPITVVMFFLSPRVGRLSMRFGPRFFMGLGPFICAAGLLLLLRLSPGFIYWRDLLGPLLVFSVGLSFIVAPLTSTVLHDAGPSDAGIASGINNAISRIAGLLGIAIVGAAVAGSGNLLGVSGFHQSMAITAALLCVGGVMGLAGIRNLT
jgi:EmrB/QacA subfamily drug resistance transporter